jgi:ParB family chromosome partitioning protein
MSAKRGGLGRGLEALIPTGTLTTEGGEVVGSALEVAIELIKPNPKQPRTVFDESLLSELSASIAEVGLLQPPVVRKISGGKYELIMGERRFRASKMAGLKTIPVIIRETEDGELLREALLENLHRSELNALEEAAAYQNLISDFSYTHEELAKKVSKSRSAITNTLRLLNLPASVQRRIAAGVLTPGHARALLALNDENQIESLANKIVSEGLSVRAVEELIALGVNEGKAKRAKARVEKSALVSQITDDLSDLLDTRITIELGKSRGRLSIEFADEADLKRIYQILA